MATYTTTKYDERLDGIARRTLGEDSPEAIYSIILSNPPRMETLFPVGHTLEIPDGIVQPAYGTDAPEEYTTLHNALNASQPVDRAPVGTTTNVSSQTGGYTTEADAIADNVVSLILDYFGERWSRGLYGTLLVDYVGRIGNDLTAADATALIQQALSNNPRFSLVSVESERAGTHYSFTVTVRQANLTVQVPLGV